MKDQIVITEAQAVRLSKLGIEADIVYAVDRGVLEDIAGILKTDSKPKVRRRSKDMAKETPLAIKHGFAVFDPRKKSSKTESFYKEVISDLHGEITRGSLEARARKYEWAAEDYGWIIARLIDKGVLHERPL